MPQTLGGLPGFQSPPVLSARGVPPLQTLQRTCVGGYTPIATSPNAWGANVSIMGRVPAAGVSQTARFPQIGCVTQTITAPQSSIMLGTQKLQPAMRQTDIGLSTQCAAATPVLATNPQQLGMQQQHKNGEIEDWLSVQSQQQRHREFGFEEPAIAAFASGVEYIGIGCYCGVTRALQCIGKKRHTYPFDWLRSPASGLLQLLNTSFANFLTYTTRTTEHGEQHGVCFGGSQWGGSFWHHDLDNPETEADFARRIDRLKGLRTQEVSSVATRVFIRAVNDSDEISVTLDIYKALTCMLPGAKIYLLVLIDFQSSTGPVCVAGSRDIMFYRIPGSLYADNGKNWTMQKQAEAYAKAIAFATKVWSGNREAARAIVELPCLESVSSACDPFDGGDPATALFLPKARHAAGVATSSASEPAQVAQRNTSNVPASLRVFQSEPSSARPTQRADVLGRSASGVLLGAGIVQPLGAERIKRLSAPAAFGPPPVVSTPRGQSPSPRCASRPQSCPRTVPRTASQRSPVVDGYVALCLPD